MGHAFECEYCESFHTATDGCEEYERRRKKHTEKNKNMKDTLITEILRPVYAVLDKYVKDVNGEDITSYLSQTEQSILADVSLAVDTVRDDLDKLFTDMLGEDDDDSDYGYDSQSVLPERDETNNVPPDDEGQGE